MFDKNKHFKKKFYWACEKINRRTTAITRSRHTDRKRKICDIWCSMFCFKGCAPLVFKNWLFLHWFTRDMNRKYSMVFYFLFMPFYAYLCLKVYFWSLTHLCVYGIVTVKILGMHWNGNSGPKPNIQDVIGRKPKKKIK